MKSEKFIIQELVPRHVYNTRGEKAWELIDERLIAVIDRLKVKFPKGRMTINNWKWGGPREWSGLRTNKSPYYSPTSQHSFGKAADIVFSEYDVEEIRQYILDNPEEFPEVRRLEMNVSWLHVDIANTETSKIVKFNA